MTALSLPVGEHSGEPYLTVGPMGAVYASWVDHLGEDEGYALRFASLAPGQTTWTTAQTIATGTDWFVNWADVPSLAVGPGGHLTAHWLARNGEGTYAYGVQVSQSLDGGASWTAPQRLHDDQSATEHGFVSLVPMGAGKTLATWLDGRKFAEGDRSMTLRARTLMADAAPGAEQLVDGLICDCCPTTAVALTGGGVLVAYRDRTADEIRDIYTARFDGAAWSTPAPVHADGWMIPGCPVNGPALAAQGDNVALAWFTAAQDTPRVQVAFSEDGGATFGTPVRLDEGAPSGRVDVVWLPEKAAVVSWIEGEGEGHPSGVMARKVHPDGSVEPALLVQPTATSRGSGYPRMAVHGEGIVFAWTDTESGRRVQTGRAVF